MSPDTQHSSEGRGILSIQQLSVPFFAELYYFLFSVISVTSPYFSFNSFWFIVQGLQALQEADSKQQTQQRKAWKLCSPSWRMRSEAQCTHGRAMLPRWPRSRISMNFPDLIAVFVIVQCFCSTFTILYQWFANDEALTLVRTSSRSSSKFISSFISSMASRKPCNKGRTARRRQQSL